MHEMDSNHVSMVNHHYKRGTKKTEVSMAEVASAAAQPRFAHRYGHSNQTGAQVRAILPVLRGVQCDCGGSI
jgi:hypothetical protein